MLNGRCGDDDLVAGAGVPRRVGVVGLAIHGGRRRGGEAEPVSDRAASGELRRNSTFEPWILRAFAAEVPRLLANDAMQGISAVYTTVAGAETAEAQPIEAA